MTSGRVLRVVVLLTAFAMVVAGVAARGQEAEGPRPELRPLFMFNQHLYYGSFNRPHGLAFDRAHKELWIADAGDGSISVFRPDGAELFATMGVRSVRQPVRIAIAPNDRIAVIEGDRTRVRLLNYRGEYIGDAPLPESAEAPIIGSVAYDSDGQLYVADNRSSQIFVYTAEGKLKRQFGSRGTDEGQFQSVCAITVDENGSIYVLDQQALAVQVFDRQGNFVRGWGRHEMGADNFSLPSGIAVTSHGDVVVTDELRHQVKVFSAEGKLLTAAGGIGSGTGQLSFPTDLAIDGEDRLYVAERGNARVQVFELVAAGTPE